MMICTCKKFVDNRGMRSIVLLKYLGNRLSIITSIESASLNWCFLILKIAEEMHHKFMRVMLHYGMKLLGDDVFQVLDLNHLLPSLVCILIEEIETITIAKVISLSRHTFVLGIVLSQIMISQLIYGSQALNKGIQVAVETVVSNSNDTFCQFLEVLMKLFLILVLLLTVVVIC